LVIGAVKALGDPKDPSNKTLVDFSKRLAEKEMEMPKKAKKMIKVYKGSRKQQNHS
jgi:hypothetical protein